MEKLYFTLYLNIVAFIRSEYSFFYILVFIVSVLTSIHHGQTENLFHFLLALQYVIYYKNKKHITPILYRLYDKIVYIIIQSFFFLVFLFINIDNFHIKTAIYIVFLIIPFIKTKNIKLKKNILYKFPDIFALSYIRNYHLLIFFVVGYLITYYMYTSYNNINQVLVIFMIINYIYSSFCSLISNYIAEINIIYKHYADFENYLSKKTALTLGLINIPFVFLFVNHLTYFDLFFMNIINHFFVIKSYYLLEMVYYNKKSTIFYNKIILSLFSLLPYLFIVNFIIFIYLDLKFKKHDKFS